MDSKAVAAADHAARHWRFSQGGASPQTGDDQHCEMFSRMLLDTHNPYKPAVIDWPALDPDARKRLTSLPIWDIAVQTEGRARLRILSYANRVSRTTLRRAFDLMAFEEGRHKEVLSHLVRAYGIELDPEPAYIEPRDPEWGMMVTGYSECVDSFFAFGLFELARRSGYFPPELVETFEPVIQEEGRHILFFVNWAAWHRRNMPLWRRPWFFLKTLAVWGYLLWERLGLAKDVSAGEKEDANFTVQGAGAVGKNIGVFDLMRIALAENERRMAGYDSRLLRPLMVPRLARLALRLTGGLRPQPAAA